MKKRLEIKPQDYGFPSKIGGMTINTISWKDFPANPPEDTWFLAYTYWNTNWTSTVKNNQGTVLTTVSIGPRAWTRAPQDFKLLEHQTGHYWIACHCALEFMKRINYTEKQPEGVQFGDWTKKIWSATASEFAKQQKRYDKQTYHYLIEKEQARWMSQMIVTFNSYHKFFELKNKEHQIKETLVQAQIKRMAINPSNQNRAMKSVPVTKKLPTINYSRQNTLFSAKNEELAKRQSKEVSVRKKNQVLNQKPRNKLVNKFEQAKNTMLNNVKLWEDLS